MRLLLLLLFVDLFYVATIWPDWGSIKSGPVPKSNFIEQYEKQRKKKGDPHLRWRTVPFAKIPEHLVRAVIVAEDSRFYQHNGFDLKTAAFISIMALIWSHSGRPWITIYLRGGQLLAAAPFHSKQ
jgi:membrane peptidoglycan carboxypeptidase